MLPLWQISSHAGQVFLTRALQMHFNLCFCHGRFFMQVEFCWVCSIYRGDSAKNFGRKSWFLVSGPGIGVMSEQRRDSPRFLRNSGAGPVILVLEQNKNKTS